MIRNLSKRERYILISAIIVIISAIFYNFIIEPIFRKWHYINNEIIITKARVRKNLKLLETQDTIINEYNTFASNLTNIPKILSYIEKEALLLEIKIANIKPHPVVRKEYYEEYIIELQIEGEFPNINRFISQLIKSPLFITVKKLDLRRTDEASLYLKGTIILSKIII